MHQIIRYISCFTLGVFVALSISISSSEHANPQSTDYHFDYPLLVDIIDTVETYYVDRIDRQQLIDAAIKGIFEQLDPYSGFLTHDDFQAINDSNKGEYFGFGFEIATEDGKITIITPFKNSPAERAGIKAGDKIIKLNDTLIDATNLQMVLSEIRQYSNDNKAISLSLLPIVNKTPITITLQPDFIHINSLNSEIINDDIGYLHLTSFQEDATDAISEQATKWQHVPLRGLILDLRNNPGGLLDQAISIADLFLDHGRIVTTTGRIFDANEDYYASQKTIFANIPMIVLINKGSASASEVLAAALQENHRATLLGETSFGKGTVQSVIPILGQSNAIKLTIANYSTPNGNNINTIGITPDIEIAITAVTDEMNMPIIGAEKILNKDYDQQIDSAIAWIDSREN
ncbi:S41 family peptidase [Shewanella sp. OMA3-2]|uniref:S41 family peptidase n=1 Tax=Shewanella sp. OMA3-2 TaxID=2908650 RepID=UPI001F270792|nr:S41 family peptidase [Shewanella sp. OMA3-2]UJF22288.1 S41 family peptidase [Shewanella sp. OMA3-2]